MFLLAIMAITSFAQNRTRKQYIPWLQSDTIMNTHTFIWRGDTILFDEFSSVLDNVTVSGNWIYFYKDGAVIDSAFFDVSQTIDTFRLNGTSLELSLSADGLKTVDLSGTYMTQAVYDTAGITEQLVGINTAQTINNKTLITPTIGNFSNANHNHSSTNTGGLINSNNITEGSTNLFSPFLESSGNVYLNTGYLGLGGVPLYLLDVYGASRTQQLTVSNSIIFDGLTITDLAPGASDNSILATKGYVDDAILSAGGYTDEQAQDAVGSTLDNGTIGDIVFTYNDGTPKISGEVENDSHNHTGTTISGLAVADFTSPNISNWTNDANYVTSTYSLTNDLTGTLASPQIVDDSHNHIISNVDALSDSLAAIRATANKGTAIDTFRLNGTSLELSLKGDGEAKKTVDLTSIGGGSYLPLTGGAMTGNILMTSNKLIGGSTTTSDLYFQSTTGAGTTGADIHFLTGNNGATEAMTITNSGPVGIGVSTPSTLLDVNGNARFRSIGTGTLSSLLGVTSDGTLTTNVPNSGNYIYNQNASAQTANMWIDGTARIGGGGVGSGVASISVTKTLTSLNKHAFDDYSLLSPTSVGLGYASFDASPSFNGVSSSHVMAYQSRINYAGSGILNFMNGLYIANEHNGAGTITTNKGIDIQDIGGTGGVSNNYGIYISPITRGNVDNYSIYARGSKSSFGGIDIYQGYLTTLDSQSKFGDQGLINGGSANGNTAISYYPSLNFIIQNGTTEVLKLNSSNNIIISDLAGTGTRLVTANSTGQLGNIANTAGYLYNDGSGNYSYVNSTFQTGTESYISNLVLSGNTLTATGVGSAFNSTVGNIANVSATQSFSGINTFFDQIRPYNSTANDYGYIYTDTNGLMNLTGTSTTNGGVKLGVILYPNNYIKLNYDGIFSPNLPTKSTETEVLYINSSTGKWAKGTVSSGITVHSSLSNLSYATAGHTDFVSTNTAQDISGTKTFTGGLVAKATSPSVFFSNTSSNLFELGWNDGTSETFLWNYQNAPIKFGVNSTEKMRLKATGQLQLNGYTSSSAFTGIAVAQLQVDANGNVITAAVGGGGNVTKVGTPVNDQISIWTGDGTLEGDVDLTFDGTNLTTNGYVLSDNNRVQSLTSATSITMNSQSGMKATLTLGHNATITITNLLDGQEGQIEVTNGNPAYTLNINGSTGYTTEKIKGSRNVINATASSSTTVVYWRTGSTLYYGFLYDY